MNCAAICKLIFEDARAAGLLLVEDIETAELVMSRAKSEAARWAGLDQLFKRISARIEADAAGRRARLDRLQRRMERFREERAAEEAGPGVEDFQDGYDGWLGTEDQYIEDERLKE